MRNTALFVLFFILPAFGQSKPTIVHFYGDGYFGTRHVPLYIDGKKVDNLHGREVIDVPITPGKHTVQSGDNHSGIYLDATDGAQYYVKVTLGGSFILHGQVTLVDPAQGEFEVQTREKDRPVKK